MKSSREQFEEYVRSKGMDDDWYFFTNIHPNHYDDENINDMWMAWQASRAAIEIELPDITSAEYESKHIEGGFRAEAFWLQIRKNILHMGLKVKS